MTALRIDMKKFKAACGKARDEFERTIEIGLHTVDEFRAQSFGEKRECYRDDYEFANTNFSVQPLWMKSVSPIDDADDLQASLNVAARAAGEFGASEAQIDFIVALAVETGDFNILSGGSLTKGEASRIISNMGD